MRTHTAEPTLISDPGKAVPGCRIAAVLGTAFRRAGTVGLHVWSPIDDRPAGAPTAPASAHACRRARLVGHRSPA